MKNAKKTKAKGLGKSHGAVVCAVNGHGTGGIMAHGVHVVLTALPFHDPSHPLHSFEEIIALIATLSTSLRLAKALKCGEWFVAEKRHVWGEGSMSMCLKRYQARIFRDECDVRHQRYGAPEV